MIESYKAGDYNSCLALAMQVLQDEPDTITALHYAARVHAQQREPHLAKPLWHKLIRLSPETAEPFLQSARIARLEQDWPSCARYIGTFLRQNPEHPEALNIQVQCHLSEGDAQKTGRVLARLSKIKPKAVPLLAMRAIGQGMGVEVAQALANAADSDDSSLEDLRIELARAARDAAIGLEIRKDLQAAANCYQAMQAYTPDSNYPTAALERLRKPFLVKAQTAYRKKAYAEAVKHARACIQISPDLAVPYIIAGRANLQLGLPEEAFATLKQGAARFWDDSWLLLNYARAAVKLGKHDIAYGAFSAIKARKDDKSKTYAAECEKQLGQSSEAATQEILALLAKNEARQACDKLFSYQQSGIQQYDFPALLAKLRQQGHSQLKALCDQEDSTAIAYAESLVRLDPEDTFAASTAGRLLVESQRYAEAYYYWMQLHELDKTNIDPLLNLARCYVNLNHKTAAITAAKALLAQAPHHKEGQEILHRSKHIKNLSSGGAE